MISKIQKFTETTNFLNALKVTIATVTPVLLFSSFGNFQIGFAMALGAFFTYPGDIESNPKQKYLGLIAAALIVSGVNLMVNLTYPLHWFPYAFLPLLLFLLSMLSAYGQRATAISFSALLSVALSFSDLHAGWEMLQYSGLILAGGLFYILVSFVFQNIRPYRYVESQIVECIKLTSKYLKLRGDLWTINADKKAIIEKQLHLQVELNTIRENIRKVLIGNSSSFGTSLQNKKMLLVFISLTEILELALSTSFDHDKLHQKFDDHPKVLKTYQKLAYNLASCLNRLSKSIENKTKYIPDTNLDKDARALELAINNYEAEVGKTSSSEGVFMLTTMLHYAEKQIEKIKIVERAFALTIHAVDLKGKDKDLEKFLTPQRYTLSTIIENFSFSSSIFRHSLRLTTTVLIGYILGEILSFHNVHWILLTIVVILRPGYGVTKKRSFQRIFGTFIGGLLGFGIISFLHNEVLLSVLAILCVLLGFSFTQINYRISATFVTMYIVFLFGILTPNILEVVQYRIVDTLVGAVLAFLANQFLWPSWEFLNFPEYLEKSINANRKYLKEISVFYNEKGPLPTSYRLARKEAFIEIGNLMASFQRMIQEPKSKQKQLTPIYKTIALNHNLLSSLASLGTYIQTHKTTSASTAFNAVIETVTQNLEDAIRLLKSEEIKINTTKEDISSHISEIKKTNKNKENQPNDATFQPEKQEIQLVTEQLVWMTNLSEAILKNTQKIIENN